MKEKLSCRVYCKKFCRIDHNKHNFVRFKSDDIFQKLNSYSEISQVSNHVISSSLGARVRQYTCNLCGNGFKKQGELKRHNKIEQRERKENGEVWEYEQTGEVS